MKTFIRRLSSRGEDAASSLASTTSASSLAESQRNPPHGGGVSGSRVSLGMASKAVDFSAAWSRIHATLDGLTSGEGLPAAEASWLALYTDVYRICTSPPVGGLGGPPAAAGAGIAGSGGGVHRRLYDHLHDFLHQHCDAVVVRLLTAAESHTAFQFLTLYADFYTLYTKGMETGGKLLAYLDRFWITKHHHKKGIDPSQGVMFIAELVPLVWRQRVLRRDISNLLQRAFNAVVADLRASPAPPPPEHLAVLRRVIGSFVALGTTLEPSHPVGFYKEQLEDHVLREVYLHYVYKAGLFAAEVSAGHADEAAVAKYVRTVEGCVAAEKAIWEPVYPSTSRGAVRVVRKSMLESQPHHQILMAFANAALAFHAERLADLELLYRLLDNEDVEPTKGIEALRNIFFGFVKEVGAREVKRANEEARHRQSSPLRPDMSHMLARSSLPPDYVCSDTIQTMLDLYSHYLTLVRVTFKDDSRFAKAFKTACEHFINALPNMSESLAIHAHYFLDKNCPESRMENVDVALDSIVLLFNFIQDKDLFHRSYARLLAARIISFSSVSDEAERRMMKHLMQVCGFQYAMTFQRMFMDKTLSFELSCEFAEWEREHRAQQQRLLLMRQKQLAEGRGVCLEGGDEVGGADGVTGLEEGGRGGAGGAGGAIGEVGRGGHGRRKSDSAIEFVETESGHVTPRSVSPKLSHGMRFIGLHDSSPLQVLLSKRVFADKVKKYKERGLVSTPASSALAPKGDLPHPSSASPQAAAQGGGGTIGTYSVMSGRTPSYHRGNTFFFGDDDMNSPGTAGAGGGGGGSGGSGGAGFSWSHSVLDAPNAKKGIRQTSGAGGEAEVEFFVFILTGGSWPYPSTGQLVQLPAPLMRCVESFSTFYDAKYKRRRLTWLHELGHGEVLFRCPASDRSYTLLVSTSQICILLLFNSRSAWSVEELQRALDLDLGELVLCLYPLLRSQVLTCRPEVAVASKLTKHHTVVVNEGLSRRGCRLAVPRKCDEAELPSALDSPRSMDPARISPTLLNERKSAIEARVVHLMKKAGSMRHDKLIEAVLQHTRQMNFLPPVDFICEVIRADIEKDFLELAEDGPNPLYRYLA